MYPTCAYERDCGHDQGETEKGTKSDLLLCLDFGSSKDDDRNADNFEDTLA